MSTSNPLDLPLITDSQTSKHVTHNNAILKLSQAMGNRTNVDVSAGNVTVTTDAAQRNFFFDIVGASASGREVTFPPRNRTLLLRSTPGNAHNVTIKITGGSDSVTMPPGASGFLVTTEAATIVGFFLAQTAVVDALVDLSDFPANYSGAGGKFLAVKSDASGVEFVDPPTSGGGGGATDLSDLSDVLVVSPSAGQLLVFDEALNRWVNQTVTTGAGATELTQLDDIALDAPAEGDALVWDAAQGKWVNRFIPGLSVGLSPSIKTADYTLQDDDLQAMIALEDCDLIVPPYAEVPLPVGTTVALVQWGAAASTIVAGDGVTIHCADTLEFAKQYAGGSLVHMAPDVWLFTAYTTEVP
jgi:hypothetical protein